MDQVYLEYLENPLLLSAQLYRVNRVDLFLQAFLLVHRFLGSLVNQVLHLDRDVQEDLLDQDDLVALMK